ISIGARWVSRQTRVVSLHRLCESFDAADRSWSMKMRAMGRGTFLAVAPFALVAALAVGVALAGFIASPHPRVEQAGSVASNASASPAPTAVAVSATPEATASPSSAPSAASSTSGPKSNDAATMLRVHNELRLAIVAPAGRADERVAAAAPERVGSPAAGQRVAGSWAGDETPDALPAGATRPVGYPVMVVYSGARSVDLKSAKLTDASGYDVGVSVVPQIYERDYAGIVPTAPLAAGARYRVRLELSVAGTDVVDEWEFETER